MFSMDEIENIDESNFKKLPTNSLDDSLFLSSLVSIVNLVERIDFSDEQDRARFQLHIINMMSEGEDIDQELSVYTALSLSAIVSLIMISLQQSETKDNFLSYFRKIIIQPLFGNHQEGEDEE